MNAEYDPRYQLARIWAIEHIAILGLIKAYRGNRNKALNAAKEDKIGVLQLLENNVNDSEELEIYKRAINDTFSSLEMYCSPDKFQL